jgi:hypothetical protein
MKTLYFFLITLTTLHTANAQDSSSRMHVSFWLGVGDLWLAHPGGSFAESLSYTATSTQTGAVIPQQFKGSLKGSLASNVFMGEYNTEIGYKAISATFGLGANRNFGAGYSMEVSLGLDYTIRRGHWAIKPGISVLWLGGRDEEVGSIDNRDQRISLGGITSGSQFVINADGDPDGPFEPDTVNTDHMNVNYSRSNVLLEPKVTLERSLSRLLFVGADLGWCIQLSQKNVLDLIQVDAAGDTGDAGSVRLKQNGYVGGPYFGIRVGVHLL